MNKDPDRLEAIVSEKRVKLHVFEPSGRRIWTVVGKGEEHWVDPESNFCSCRILFWSIKWRDSVLSSDLYIVGNQGRQS